MSSQSPDPQNPAIPPTQTLMQMGSGYWASLVLSVSLRLNLIEEINMGHRNLREVAERLNLNPQNTVRLLRGCCSLGVALEGPIEHFSLTPLGEFLTNDHPQSLRDALIMMTDPGHWNSWGELEHTVRSGQPGYRKALGVENVFDYFRSQPEEAERFNLSMASMTRAFVAAVDPVYEFAKFPVLADIGGGHGQLIGHLLQLAPQSQGWLFDQPPVVAGAAHELEKLGTAQRVKCVAGDFFQEIPHGADLYLLKHILHDWTDELCIKILKNLAAAMKPTARALVIELVLAEPPALCPHAMMDLNMMMMTGGRERTVAQYAELCQQAGLRVSQAIPTHGPLTLVEIVPA